MSLKEFNNEPLNLEILAEEAAEIIEEALDNYQTHGLIKVLSQIIRIKSKIIRFGFNNFHKKNKLPNNEKLEQEIGHFLAMVEILIANKTLSKNNINKGMIYKIHKLGKWYKKEIKS